MNPNVLELVLVNFRLILLSMFIFSSLCATKVNKKKFRIFFRKYCFSEFFYICSILMQMFHGVHAAITGIRKIVLIHMSERIYCAGKIMLMDPW